MREAIEGPLMGLWVVLCLVFAAESAAAIYLLPTYEVRCKRALVHTCICIFCALPPLTVPEFSQVLENTEIVWQKPTGTPRALLLIAHGCSHSAVDFWPKSGRCPTCLGQLSSFSLRVSGSPCLQLLSVACKSVATPNGAVVGQEYLLAIFPAKIGVPGSDFLDLRPRPLDPPECAPDEVLSRRCWSGKPGDDFLETPFWQGFCLSPGPPPWARPGSN
eukprot:515361-Pelagomonas_calceolata.AAC.2